MKKACVVLAALVIVAASVPAYASGRVSSEVADNIAIVHHDEAWFNCCPEMVFEIRKDGYTIDIFEQDTLPQCDCMCYFDFTHTFKGLAPGTYVSSVWESTYPGQDYLLAGTTEFTIPYKVGTYAETSLRSQCGGWPAVEEGSSGREGLEVSTPSVAHSPVKISYTLPEAASVTIAIYDVIGAKVRTSDLGFQEAGDHLAVWDTRSDAGQPVPRGIYFVRLQASGEARSLTLIVVR